VRRFAESAFAPLVMGTALVGTAIGVAPLAAWSVNPPRDLEAAAEQIAALGEETVLVGDWAPQLGLLTNARTIYSNWNEGMGQELNVTNLREIGATHVVIVDVINARYLERLDALHPGARSEEPALRFEYAGQGVSIYEFEAGDKASP
jgi:hypothetical protein